jgi:PAS domain S-box-containing protein
MLVLPLAKKFRWFWAEIPGHVAERAIGQSEWSRKIGPAITEPGRIPAGPGLPIRIFIFAPFIVLLLLMVGATAIVVLRSADDDAALLATRLHQQMSINVRMSLDDELAKSPSPTDTQQKEALESLLRSHVEPTGGRAFILDKTGNVVVSSAAPNDPVVGSAVSALARHAGPSRPTGESEFEFDHITEKPLSRETWLAYAVSYPNDKAGQLWTSVVATPESFYLAGFRRANSRSAMVFALALVLSLVLAAALAQMVTAPLRRIADTTKEMADGDLGARVPGSGLEELGAVAESFNDMATRLEASFDTLVREIDMRKRRERDLAESEARLRMSEERWRSLFETSTLGIMVTDHQHRMLETNKALQTMLGYAAHELKQLSPVDLMHEEERRAGSLRLAGLREGKRTNYEVVTRYRRKDGTSIWLNTFVSTIPGNEKSEPIYFATAIDITARHKAEIELRRYATYLAEAERLSHTGCWARNMNTGDLFWSEEEWRIFGLDRATTKLTYQVFLDLVHPQDRDFFEKESLRAIKNSMTYDMPFRAVLRDGAVKHLHIVGKPLFDESGGVVEYIGVTRDETERVSANTALHDAQAELAQMARLTTMGELSASIAHEISQPLGAITANSHAALSWLAYTPPNLGETKDALHDLLKEATRANDVIGRIRELLKRRQPEYANLIINDVIREVLALTASTLNSRNIAVQTQLLDELPAAPGDRVQLQQVIMNLIMNGADAMSEVTEGPRILQIRSALNASGEALVSVEDSGNGIDEAIRDRIFNPLFSTKPAGMGMGLSICRSIVEAHGGRLWASPAAPHGAILQFTIPASPT